MDFIKADQLKNIFNVSAHFYNLRISGSLFQCRSVLEIRRTGEADLLPDMIVVMMNPGSSTPLDKSHNIKTFSKAEYNKEKTREMIPTKPDPAQYQIMRLMQTNSWSFVRILNLSDLRNGNSGAFQLEYLSASKLDDSNPHCITHKDRSKELLDNMKSKNSKVIVAWGSIAELKDSAFALLKLNKDFVGLETGKKPNYLYASPSMKTYKVRWLTEIQKEIDKSE